MPTEFQDRVYDVVKTVPSGKATSYGAVAFAVGGSPRAVGTAMKRCKDDTVPCHRVIAADRRLGGYGGVRFGPAVATKRRMLEDEGCVFDSDKVADDCFLDPLPHKRRRRSSP